VSAERILEERAARLARPLPASSGVEEGVSLLVFRRGGDAFGVDALAVVQVLPRTAPTRLPGTRAFLPGVIHVREALVAVLDLPALLGGRAAATDGTVVVVSAGGMTLGLLADEVLGISAVPAAEADARTESQAAPAWVRGTTSGLVTVLDVEALARDARISVDEAGA
jgi:purine-binding chemotaxis protein CheW